MGKDKGNMRMDVAAALLDMVSKDWTVEYNDMDGDCLVMDGCDTVCWMRRDGAAMVDEGYMDKLRSFYPAMTAAHLMEWWNAKVESRSGGRLDMGGN